MKMTSPFSSSSLNQAPSSVSPPTSSISNVRTRSVHSFHADEETNEEPAPAPPMESPVVTAARLGKGLLRKLSLLSVEDANTDHTEPLLSNRDSSPSQWPLERSQTFENNGNGNLNASNPLFAGEHQLVPFLRRGSTPLISRAPSILSLSSSLSSSPTSLPARHPSFLSLNGQLVTQQQSSLDHQMAMFGMTQGTCPTCHSNSPHPHMAPLLSMASRRIHRSAVLTMLPNQDATSSPYQQSPMVGRDEAVLGGPTQASKQPGSLASRSSRNQQVLFLVLTIAAVVCRLLALLTVTTENSLWVTMTVRHKHLDLSKQMFQKGFFPEMLEDLYHAGAYSSFAMMFLGAVLVPLVRICLVVFCFFVPVTTTAGEDRRTKTLFVLDHVGRFILIDVFAIGYGAVFSYHDFSILQHIFPPGRVPLVTPGSIVEDLRVTLSMQLFPTFYCGIISNILGTLLTHHMLLMSIPKHPLSEKDMDDRTTLFGRFSLERRQSFRWYQTSTALVVAVLVAMGCFIHLALLRAPVISFKAAGFTSQLMTPNEEVVFDIWTLVSKMPSRIYYDQDTKGFQYIGAYVLAFVYLLVILSIPLSLMIVALALLVIPMHKQFQYHVLFSSPFWFSWCSIDVFFFFTVSEYFEMDPISKYMTKIQYPEFCSVVEKRFKMDCTGVDTKFYVGIYSLAGLCLALMFIRARFLWLYEQMSEHQTEERLPSIF